MCVTLMGSITSIWLLRLVKLPYPNRWQEIEEKYGEPMEVLLPRLANELGSLNAVARRFEVRRETIWKWGKRIELSRVCEFRSKSDTAPSGAGK